LIKAPRSKTAFALTALAVLAGPATAALGATLTISATLTGDATVGETLTETITLSGGAAPNGFLRLTDYRPNDATCADDLSGPESVQVTGNGQYTIQTIPEEAGLRRYVVSYDGDASNDAASTACGDPGQTVTVGRARSTLTTTASLGPGNSVVDAARLTRVYWPTGTVTFVLYGPGDDACMLPPLFSSIVSLDQSFEPRARRAASEPYTATVPGTYRWVAAYSGDDNNLPAAGTCGDTGELVTFAAPAPPSAASLRLRALADGTVGGQLRATVTLTTPGFPSGRLTFRVFRPGDDGCRLGAVAASTRTVAGNGDYSSDPFTPDEPGTYRVVAAYDGDDGTGLTTRCDDSVAQLDVTPPAATRPVLARSVTVERLDGTVLVHVAAPHAGASAHASAIGFVEVRRARSVPVGSTVDTRSGLARITSETRRSGLQSGSFGRGRFVVRQRAGSDHVEVQLRPRAGAKAMCAAGGQGAAHAAKRRKLDRTVVGKLHAKVRGRFGTRGEHSSASAHGTEWLMLDRCDGTLTRVLSGVVAVRDFRLGRTRLVHAGHSYLARAGG